LDTRKVKDIFGVVYFKYIIHEHNWHKNIKFNKVDPYVMKSTFNQLVNKIKLLETELKKYRKSEQFQKENLNEDFIVLKKAHRSILREYNATIKELSGKNTLIYEVEKKTQNILQNIPIAFQTLDKEGKILDINNYWLALLGYERNDVTGKPFINFIQPNYISSFKDHFQLLEEKVEISQVQLALIGKDTRAIHVSCHSYTIFSEEGSLYQVHFTFNNIENDNELVKPLTESESMLETLLSNLSGMAYRCVHKEGRPMEFVSDGCFDLTGYTKEELCINGIIEFGELIHPDDRDFIWSEVQKAYEGKKRFEFEYRITTRQGRQKWVWERGTFLNKKNNSNESILEGFITDITQRKNTEYALKESEEYYKAMFYHNKSVMLLIDPSDGTIIDANESALKYYGYSLKQLISMNIDNINILSSDEIRKEMKRTVSEERNFFQFRHRLADGQIRDVQVYSGKIIMHKKELLYSIIHDNTNEQLNEKKLIEQNEEYQVVNESLQESLQRIKKINEELEISKEKAEESDRLKSVFLANMSHEIRTPMNGIIGFASLLKRPELSGEKQTQYIKIIENSGKRMLSTLNELIDISKIEAGQVTINNEHTNINVQLRNLFDFFFREANEKGLCLTLQKKLSTEDSILYTDKEKIYAILTNLIKNAIKYTKKGGIDIGYNVVGQTIEFFVKDTGTGISKERQNVIFDRFVQADLSPSNPYEGVGLGLAISRAYVKMLGGKIWLESEVGQGSTFYFSVPYHHEDEDEPELDLMNKTAVRNSLGKKPTILIVEDDEVANIYLTEILKDESGKLLFSNNGKDAVEICKENENIDVVLMDIKMPVMDGYAATKEIKSFRPGLPIIAQTAFALTSDKDKALDFGFDGFITKPIKEAELLKLIKSFINKPKHTNEKKV
jgi:PAS domain S-box-containing protein